jgi:hypothetical protein
VARWTGLVVLTKLASVVGSLIAPKRQQEKGFRSSISFERWLLGYR